MIGGIGPVPVSVSRTELQGGHTVELLACQAKDPRDRAIVRRRQASYITVVLSKAALSGPSVCLRARAPCPLRVSCTGADRALRVQQSLQATACSASCRPCALPSSPSGTRQVLRPTPGGARRRPCVAVRRSCTGNKVAGACAGRRRMPRGQWRPALGGRPRRRPPRRRASPAPFFLAGCSRLSDGWVSCRTWSVGWRARCGRGVGPH